MDIHTTVVIPQLKILTLLTCHFLWKVGDQKNKAEQFRKLSFLKAGKLRNSISCPAEILGATHQNCPRSPASPKFWPCFKPLLTSTPKEWCKHQMSWANDSYKGFNLTQNVLLQILANNQSYSECCKNTPGINLITVILPLITTLIMTAQVCSRFCPTNSKDIKLLSSPESTWEHVLYRMKLWLSPACWEPLPGDLVSLRCLFGFWHPWELCSSIWNSSITPALERGMGDPNQLIWRNLHKNYFQLAAASQSSFTSGMVDVLWDFSAAEISHLKK